MQYNITFFSSCWIYGFLSHITAWLIYGRIYMEVSMKVNNTNLNLKGFFFFLKIHSAGKGWFMSKNINEGIFGTLHWVSAVCFTEQNYCSNFWPGVHTYQEVHWLAEEDHQKIPRKHKAIPLDKNQKKNKSRLKNPSASYYWDASKRAKRHYGEKNMYWGNE